MDTRDRIRKIVEKALSEQDVATYFGSGALDGPDADEITDKILEAIFE